MKRIPVVLIHGYRATLGKLIGGRCKYYPSCSQYALDAYRFHGVARATFLTSWRLLRCNPWSHGGVDHACQEATPGRSR